MHVSAVAVPRTWVHGVSPMKTSFDSAGSSKPEPLSEMFHELVEAATTVALSSTGVRALS